MKPLHRLLIIIALAAAVSIVLVRRAQEKGSGTATPAAPAANLDTPLPRLVDLGAGKCIPCKAMKPILDELRAEYADIFHVTFIDVWEDPEAAKPYGINLIPTQIFYDAEGRERWRHEGFLGKADILAKWKELGVLN
jgi:thioredoxin 1